MAQLQLQHDLEPLCTCRLSCRVSCCLHGDPNSGITPGISLLSCGSVLTLDRVLVVAPGHAI
jgi:hypothetical protein